MNQRVGICTAMILHPNLLLADEPTSALDVTVQKQVAEELLFMRKTYNTAMILVTHNIGVVRMMQTEYWCFRTDRQGSMEKLRLFWIIRKIRIQRN